MQKIKIAFLALALLLVFGAVLAQEDAAVNLDENVTADDLGITEPTLLPDSPFYFLKNITRAVQTAFTFNAVRKAELKERFSSEKLLEVRKMVEENKNREEIEEAVRNWREEIGEMKQITEKIKEKAQENEEVGKFLDKFIQQQTLHQRILQKLETRVSTSTFAKIHEAREDHLERFGEVMTKLENKEKIQERLEKNLQEMEGSEFKNFKNLEMLQSLEEKSPQAIREAIQNVRANVLTEFKEEIREMTAEKLERFQDYAENVSGSEETKVEILENLKAELKNEPDIIQNILQIRTRIMEQAEENTGTAGTVCPAITKPAAAFCQNGRLVTNKNDRGCVVSFDCVLPAETNLTPTPNACITLWDPVCGRDGNTYSNSCFAKLAGVEIADDEACKSLETGTSPQIREQIKSASPNMVQ